MAIKIPLPPASYNTYAQLAHLESFYKNGSPTLTAIIGTRIAVIDIAARAFCDFARFLADALQAACRMTLNPSGRISSSLCKSLGNLTFAVYSITIGLLFPSAVVKILDQSSLAGRGAMHRACEVAKIAAVAVGAVGLFYGFIQLVMLGEKERLAHIQKCRAAEADPKILTDYEWLSCKSLACPPCHEWHHYRYR